MLNVHTDGMNAVTACCDNNSVSPQKKDRSVRARSRINTSLLWRGGKLSVAPCTAQWWPFGPALAVGSLSTQTSGGGGGTHTKCNMASNLLNSLYFPSLSRAHNMSVYARTFRSTKSVCIDSGFFMGIYERAIFFSPPSAV